MRCQNCGTENDERNLTCQNCGAELAAEDHTENTPAEEQGADTEQDDTASAEQVDTASGEQDTAEQPAAEYPAAKKKIGKKMFLPVIAAAVLILVLALFRAAVVPEMAANKMRAAFNAKSGEQVISVFEKYCSGTGYSYADMNKTGKAVYDAFVQCVQDAKEALNSQPAETDIDEYLTETYGDIFIPAGACVLNETAMCNTELLALTEDFFELYLSKTNYADGIEAYNAGNYESAEYCFLDVRAGDSFYDDAQSKLAECEQKLLEKEVTAIEAYIKSGEYDLAESKISELRSENLTDEMSTKLDEYETKIYNARLAKIDEYIDSGDFDGANEYIESLGSGLSADAQTRLDEAVKAKAAEYITKAEEALKSGEREGAYDMAQMAGALCPDDDEITEKVEYFKEYLPFKLYIKDNYLSQKVEQGSIDYNQKCTSNNSVTMYNCVEISDFAANSSNYLISTTYNLNKTYDVVSGTQFVTKDSKNNEQKGYFEIYGDGKKIFTSSTMGINFLPKDFSVSVSGVDTLVVKYYGETLTGGFSYYGISNFVATKNLPKSE